MATFKVHLPEGGFVSFEAPDNATDDQLQAAGQARVAQHQENLKAETTRARAEADPTADMSGAEKIAANLGAGFSNLGQGVKSLYTKAVGSKDDQAAMDADIREKRALDEQLANKTTGGAALQLAGEVAPSLLIPAGAFAGGAARAAGTVLPRVLGQVGTRAAGAAGRMAGSTVADSALAGATSGALAPTTSDESTLARVAGGAVLGAAVPWLGAKVGDAVSRLNPWGSGESAAARQVGEALGGAGGSQADRVAAAQRVADQIRSLPAGAPPGNIPLSTAARLESPELGWLEVGNRARGGANWMQHDSDFAHSLADALGGATSEAGEIGTRVARKNERWNSNMQEALDNVDPDAFAQHVGDLRAHIDNALASPEAVNPRVRALYTQMARDIDEAGPNFSPAHMQQMRANFNEKANPLNPSAYATAPRESTAVRGSIEQLDNILNDTTGGRWQRVLDDYTADVGSVNEAKAAQRLRENFYTPEGRIRGTATGAAGDLPSLTEAGFQRASGRDEAMFSPQAQAQVDAIQNALRGKNFVQRLKTSATAGGGSATAPTMYAARDAGAFASTVANALRGVPGAGVIGGALQGAGRIATANQDRALSHALQNPQAMLQLLERVQASGRQMTPAQDALLRALREGSQGVAAAATN